MDNYDTYAGHACRITKQQQNNNSTTRFLVCQVLMMIRIRNILQKLKERRSQDIENGL
jgi:hypothetical protein